MFRGAVLVFVATGCVAIDACAQALAKAAACPVNVVDQPHLCDVTTPSLVDRDPVVIAIGTEGTAPVLARQIKTRIEHSLPQNLGGLAALAGRLRPSVAKNVPRARRRAFWAWVFSGRPRALWDRGVEAHAASAIKTAIAQGVSSPSTDQGSVTLIDAGVGDPGLQTLRAVQRLQEADVIFFERESDQAILELARRDADRVFLGDADMHRLWTDNWVQNRLLAEARQGRHVALLTARYRALCLAEPAWRDRMDLALIPLDFVPSAGPDVADGASPSRQIKEPSQSAM